MLEETAYHKSELGEKKILKRGRIIGHDAAKALACKIQVNLLHELKLCPTTKQCTFSCKIYMYIYLSKYRQNLFHWIQKEIMRQVRMKNDWKFYRKKICTSKKNAILSTDIFIVNFWDFKDFELS